MAEDIEVQLRFRHAACSCSSGLSVVCHECEIDIAAAAEIERLRAHIEHLVSTHPLAAEYEAQTADPSVWMTDRETRHG